MIELLPKSNSLASSSINGTFNRKQSDEVLCEQQQQQQHRDVVSISNITISTSSDNDTNLNRIRDYDETHNSLIEHDGIDIDTNINNGSVSLSQQQQSYNQSFVNSTTRFKNRVKKNNRERSFTVASPIVVQIRYVSLASIAILMSITCPGQTLLWKDNNSKTQLEMRINYYELCKLLVVYILVIVTFFIVHGTDPGYITPDVINQWYSIQESTNNNTQQNQNKVSDTTEQNQYDEESVSLLLSSSNQNQHQVEADDGSLDNHNKKETIKVHHLHTENLNSTITPKLDEHSRVVILNSNTIDVSLTTRTKYCSTCQFYPPIRSHHCKEEKYCVATFDHYCYFIGTCIGERNHCKFYIFLVCQMIGFIICCTVLSSSKLSIITELFKLMSSSSSTSKYNHPMNPTTAYSNVTSTTTTVQSSASSIDTDVVMFWFQLLYVTVCKLYLYPLTLVASIMFIIHTFMMMTNSTTYECSKGSKYIDYLQNIDSMDLPFSFSNPFYNVYHFCCIRNTMTILTNPVEQLTNDLNTTQSTSSSSSTFVWIPIVWRNPNHKIMTSYKTNAVHDKWYNNLWRNQYWSCC